VVPPLHVTSVQLVSPRHAAPCILANDHAPAGCPDGLDNVRF
jgi:hypothetical protein